MTAPGKTSPAMSRISSTLSRVVGGVVVPVVVVLRAFVHRWASLPDRASTAFDPPGHDAWAGGRRAPLAFEHRIQRVAGARPQRPDHIEAGRALADPGRKCGHRGILCSFRPCADPFHCTTAVLRGHRTAVNVTKTALWDNAHSQRDETHATASFSEIP